MQIRTDIRPDLRYRSPFPGFCEFINSQAQSHLKIREFVEKNVGVVLAMIWHNKHLNLQDIISLGKGTMADHVGIEWTEVGPDFLKARMPVDHRTNQPYGLLHGGASAVLAETLGSVGSAMVVDHSKFYCVGLEINANHIRSARQGYVTGKASPLHLGRQTHVWDIKIYNEEEKLVCVSRLTVAILPRQDA